MASFKFCPRCIEQEVSTIISIVKDLCDEHTIERQQQKITTLENKLAIAEEALESADIDMGLCYGYIISRIRKFNRKDDNMSLAVSVFKENITEALAKIREEKIK